MEKLIYPYKSSSSYQLVKRTQENLEEIGGGGDDVIPDIAHAMVDDRIKDFTMNLSFSYYAKFLALILTFNTLLLFKILFWDHLVQKGLLGN